MAIKTISEIIEEVSPYYKKKKEPEVVHIIDHDTNAETVEAIYFFILDLMNDVGLNVEKLVDNFTSTPGSQHFSETGIKASRIQDEAIKIMGSVNTVLRSILNIVYDLRDFQTRLAHYESLRSKNPNEKESAVLALKQIWMDKVDITKGNSSIKAMAFGQAGFQTLIDAFLIVKDQDDVNKLDLNDRVKRILKPRIFEFNLWLDKSESELRKRFEIEKNYLKSQVSSLKLYSRWVKPYLRAAHQLEMKDNRKEPSLVNMFNTIRLELTLLGKLKMDPKKLALSGDLPRDFYKMKLKREFYSCVLVEFVVRAIPKQGVFVGKSQISFKAYALSEDELKKLDEEIEKSDIGDVLSLIEGSTAESLEQLKGDIDYFLKTELKTEKSGDESNPFMALIGKYGKKTEQKQPSQEKPKETIVKPDGWTDKYIRKYTAEMCAKTAFLLFDVYKKVHGMPSYT